MGRWSRAVDNGFSDHNDRHAILSEISFGSVGFSELALDRENVEKKAYVSSESSFETLEREDDGASAEKGKGKELEDDLLEKQDHSIFLNGRKDPTEAHPSSAVDSIMEEAFFCEQGEDDFDFGDSGDETETEDSYVKI